MTEEGLCGKLVFKNRNFGRKLNLLLFHISKWISRVENKTYRTKYWKVKRKMYIKTKEKEKRWVDSIK